MSNLQYLSNVELLSELIGKDATQRLYQGSIRNLFSAAEPDTDLYNLYLAREVMERACVEELARRSILSTPDAVREYLRTFFIHLPYEAFLCIFLDVQNRLITSEQIFRGTLTHTSAYPREIARRAIQLNAASVIFSHNHPSGESNPSAADIKLTETLRQALSLIEVHVIDHLIVAGIEIVSLAERGAL